MKTGVVLKKLITPFMDENGYTLPGLFVALAASSALGLVFLEQARIQDIIVAQGQSRHDIMETRDNIQKILANPEACRRTFAGYAPGDSGIPEIYKANRLDSGNAWETAVQYRTGRNYPIAKNVYLENIALKGSLEALNTGALSATFRFVQTRKVFGNSKLDRDVVINARLDNNGRIMTCQTTAQTYQSNLLCTDVTQCTNSNLFCEGQFFQSSTSSCLCTGSKVCTVPSPTPSSSPSSTPTGTPSSTPSPTAIPSPTSTPSGMYLVDGKLSNGQDAIDFKFTLSQSGFLHYAVYDADPGVLDSTQVKTAAGTAPSGTLVASGSYSYTSEGVSETLSIPGLPNYKLYTVYFVAENPMSADLDSSVRRYEKVTPRVTALMRVNIRDSGGIIRPVNYFLSYPEGFYDTTHNWPTIMYWNGAGGNTNDIAFSEASVWAKLPHHLLSNIRYFGYNLPFIIVAGNCNEAAFSCYSGNNEMADGMLTEAKTNVPRVDFKRIYSIGQSSGGGMSERSIYVNPGQYAAALVSAPTGIVTASSTASTKNLYCTRAAGTKIWITHTVADDRVPVSNSQGFYDVLTSWCNSGAGLNPKPILTFTNSSMLSPWNGTGHQSWNGVYGYTDYLVNPILPLFPEIVTELNAINALEGTSYSNFWDWLAAQSRP